MRSDDSSDIKKVLAFLKDPVFAHIYRLVDKHPLTWSEFCELKMPENVSCNEAWDIINTIRRHTAIESPFTDGAGRLGWYYPTRSIIAGLEDIEKRCHTGSRLDVIVNSRNMVYYAVEVQANEAITCLKEDGLDIDYESAREMLLSERTPDKPVERLLSNKFQTMRFIDEQTGTSCTPELIQKIYTRVSEGFDLKATPKKYYNESLWKPKHQDKYSVLSLISKLVNNSRLEDTEHPLLLAMGIRYLFTETQPLPAWNSTVGSLLIRLLFNKAGLHVLTYTPVNKIVVDWAQGAYQKSLVLPSISESEILVGDSVDYTVFMDVLIRLVIENLNEMESYLERLVKRDEDFLQTLRDGLDINYRQRDILHSALSNPEKTFRIGEHQKRFWVAYATARTDLLQLTEQGFLRCSRNGHAFEFFAVPDLRQLVMNR